MKKVRLRARVGARRRRLGVRRSIAVVYEGAEHLARVRRVGAGADGTKYFLFGYMNRNWEEEIDVPVGPDNGFNVGGADQGQPTHFLPRRNRFVFRVKVPAGFRREGRARLDAHHARQDREGLRDAASRLRRRQRGEGVGDRRARRRHQQSRSARQQAADGAHRGGQDAHREGRRTAHARQRRQGRRHPEARDRPSRGAAGGPGALAGAIRALAAAQLRNPAMSPPTRITVGKNLGLHVSWFVYRGPVGGQATFDPPQVKAWEDTRAGANSPWAPQWAAPKLPADGMLPVQVTFSRAGYLCARAAAPTTAPSSRTTKSRSSSRADAARRR